MIKFVVTFVFEQQWWAVTVQTFSEIANESNPNTSKHTYSSVAINSQGPENKKKGGTEGTESSSFWLHHCVKCQRKQDACLSFSDFLHVKVSQSTGEFVLVNVLVLRVVFEGAVWSRAARGPPEEALLPERAATTERNNLLLQDSTVREVCHTHTHTTNKQMNSYEHSKCKTSSYSHKFKMKQ